MLDLLAQHYVPDGLYHSLFFSLLHGISLNKYTLTYMSFLPLMDFCVVFSFYLLWEKVLWISLYMFFGGHMHSFLLGIYQGVELLGHRVDISSALVKLLVCLHSTKLQRHKRASSEKSLSHSYNSVSQFSFPEATNITSFLCIPLETHSTCRSIYI